jgi:hypothetical protein
MATTTTNFGWDIPQSTDLVKDGATAIAALGQDIDTALVDLKGGTTGQVLAKATNTDLDFSWVAQDDSNAIQNAIVDAKGDLIAATGADTPARLAVGTNGQVLIADSTAGTGLAWSTPSSGFVLISRTSYSNVASQAFDNVFNSTYKSYFINIEKTAGSTNNNLLFSFRKNSTSVSTSSYYGNTFGYNYAGTLRNTPNSGTTSLTIIEGQGDQTDRWSTAQIYANFVGYTKTTGERSLINGTGLVSKETYSTVIGGGLYDSGGDNCNGFILSSNTGNIYGTVSIYGVAI